MKEATGTAAGGREVVVVSYHFPPVTSAGVTRVLGLCKYLGRRGWRVEVVTVKRSYCEPADEGSLRLVPPGTRVLRVPSWEVDRLLGRWLGKRGRRSAFGKLLRAAASAIHRLLSFPDRQWGWVPPLFLHLLRTLSGGKRRVVLSSTPPHSTHLGLLLLRPLRRFKWVVDFRDPWTAPNFYYENKILRRMAGSMEARVLASCDLIMANTEGNRQRLLEAFPFLPEDKIMVVTNGFDPEWPRGEGRAEVGGDLLYAGEIYDGMMDLYLQALHELKARTDQRAPRLVIYGDVYPRYRDAVTTSGLNDLVVYRGKVSWQESLELMGGAPALLLLLPHTERGKTWVPSKLYAYLYARRPVLAIVPEGDAATIVRRTGCGTVLSSSRPSEVADGIARFIDGVRQGWVKVEPVGLEEFQMDKLAARVHSALRRIDAD